MDDLFTTHDAARILGLHPFTVARHVDEGHIKAFRTGGGHRRIAASDLRDYLVAHQMPLPPELEGKSEKLKLLVVDDEEPVLRAIKRAFKKASEERPRDEQASRYIPRAAEGGGRAQRGATSQKRQAAVEITSTTSGIQALLMLGELKPDAVLIDLKMPELDGFEVCRRVRALKAFANVKVVAMTSLYRSDIIGSALTAGAVGCLAKPINAEEVLALITEAAPARRRRVADGPCAVVGCERRRDAKGYCQPHYQHRKFLERTDRLPADWVEHAAPHSVPESLLRAGRSAASW